LIAGCIPFSSVEKIELPIFRPNEYFFTHHQKEGEERWMTYSRVMRELISEAGGLELSNQQIEDKFEYKHLLYDRKLR
jgi:hypothetical protein